MVLRQQTNRSGREHLMLLLELAFVFATERGGPFTPDAVSHQATRGLWFNGRGAWAAAQFRSALMTLEETFSRRPPYAPCTPPR